MSNYHDRDENPKLRDAVSRVIVSNTAHKDIARIVMADCKGADVVQRDWQKRKPAT